MKHRIVFSIIGVAAIAVLLVGVPLALAVEHLYTSQEILRLEREASDARRGVGVTTVGTETPIVLPNGTGPSHYAVYGPAGGRLSGVGPDSADRPVRHALGGVLNDARQHGEIVVAVPINGDDRIVGALRVSTSASYVVDRTRRTWLVIGIIGAAALGVAAVLAQFLARRLARPVDALVDAAERIGAGDFSVRTEPSGVDELDHLGSALDTTAERLGGLVPRERAFSADASHQLRTPLAGLRVHVESALLTPGADPREALAGTLEPIDRLEVIVDTLLRLARDTHIDRSPLDLTALVRNVDDWRRRLESAGRSLHVVVDGELPAPTVSGPVVHQILDVLVDNAATHGRGAVAIHVRRVPGAVAIEVGDEGTSVLDPRQVFVRRTEGGHGIGLALARTLAEGEGGRLILEHPGPAPRFALLLPVPEADHHDPVTVS